VESVSQGAVHRGHLHEGERQGRMKRERVKIFSMCATQNYQQTSKTEKLAGLFAGEVWT